MILTCVTKHAFQGNPSERQVSFSAGERVIYETAHNGNATQGGWVWVKLVSNPVESSGWCPQTYLSVLNDNMVVPPAPIAAASVSVTTNGIKYDDTDDDDGFSGSIMGGSSANNPSQEPVPFAVATPVITAASTSRMAFPMETAVATPPMATATVQGNNRVAGAFRNFGSNVQQAGQRSWRAVSNGAQTAGKAISNGAQTAGKAVSNGAQTAGKAVSNGAQTAGKAVSNGASKVPRLIQREGHQDKQPQTNCLININNEKASRAPRWLQQGGKQDRKPQTNCLININVAGLQQKQRKISNKPQWMRTKEEQRAVDIGNFAAREAVVNGVYHGIMSGGNPMALVRGATRGAVAGGLYGGVARWKPFG